MNLTADERRGKEGRKISTCRRQRRRMGSGKTKVKLHVHNTWQARQVRCLSMFDRKIVRTLNVLKDLNWISQSVQYRSPSFESNTSLSSDSSVVPATDPCDLLDGSLAASGGGRSGTDPFVRRSFSTPVAALLVSALLSADSLPGDPADLDVGAGTSPPTPTGSDPQPSSSRSGKESNLLLASGSTAHLLHSDYNDNQQIRTSARLDPLIEQTKQEIKVCSGLMSESHFLVLMVAREEFAKGPADVTAESK